MGSGEEVDWAKGLSKRIRQLVADGASDGLVDLYIAATKAGDYALVEHVMARIAARETDLSERDTSILEDALRRIRIAALRTEVNHLDGHLLLPYVLFVMEFSGRLVEACADSVDWDNATMTQNLAEHVREVAIEWLRTSPWTPPA